MRLAGFPSTSPWFRRSLGPDGEAEIAAAEPARAQVNGIADKRGVTFTVRIALGDRAASATSRTALQAFHKAQAAFAAQEEAA